MLSSQMTAMLKKQVFILVVAVQCSLQCSLPGELCLWNIFHFHQFKNSVGNGMFLHSNSTFGYVESPFYANSTESSCVLRINSTLSEGTRLNLIQIKENLTDYLEPYNITLLATLRSNDTYREISLPRTNNSFKLKLFVVQEGNGERINAIIKSVNLAYCTPKRLLKYSSQCSPKNGLKCDGWNITHVKDPMKWTVQDDYYRLTTTIEDGPQHHAKLFTATWPYRPNPQCEWSYEYRLNISIERAPTSVIYYYFYSRNGTRLGSQGDMNDAILTPSEGWKTMRRLLDDQGLPATSFKIELRTYGNNVYSVRDMRNLVISENCLPQLQLKTSSLPEALLCIETHAANLSVADRATSYSFHTCGSTGSSGPTSEQCHQYYSTHSKPAVEVKISEALPGVQQWIVPKTNDYDVILFGAAGGFGTKTKTEPGMVRGYAEYYRHNQPNLPLWPSKLHLKVKLYGNEKLYIVVGQAGSTGCPEGQGKDCNNDNGTADEGGGGAGGGGASMVLVERDGKTVLVGIAGGGGGMGKMDVPPKDEYLSQIKRDCDSNLCRSRRDRPGFGGSYYTNENASQPLLLLQDGRPLSWLFNGSDSLRGGRGCENYSDYFDTHGGFGGGGGGCTAGGGGGGYQGGLVSLKNNPLMPGLQGDSYHNPELAELVLYSQHAPFAIPHPNGWVEITEVPPPCECGERKCRYLYPNYTDYNCLCDKKWVPKHKLHTCKSDLKTKDKITATTIAVASTIPGVIVVAALLVFIGRVCRRRRTHTVMGHTRIKMDENPNYPSYEGAPDTLAWERIKIIGILGEGNFSKVFEARLALSDSWNSPEIIVAVKKPKENTVVSRAEFLQEARIISAFNHPNIMKIIGTCELPDGNIGIAMDVLKGGNLRAFLRENKPIGEEATCSLMYGDLIRIAFEISSACKYLEEMKYIHRDLAARNVLLTEKGKMRVAKISDFGLSRDVNHGDYCRKSPMRDVPIRWYPPEAIKINHMQTTKSDVWSYGVLLWELFTLGDQPYTGLENYQVAERIAQGYTMDPPTACPRPIGDLMRRCWMYEAKDRPAFSFIHLQFNRLLQNEALMNSSLGDLKHLRGSVTSSVSSGFDEMPDSPSCLSIKPLLDVSYHNGSESGISNTC